VSNGLRVTEDLTPLILAGKSPDANAMNAALFAGTNWNPYIEFGKTDRVRQ
jgi:hypothetical protein